MTEPVMNSVNDLVYSTGRSIEQEQFLFSCRGSFNTGIIDNILFLTESNLLKLDSPKVSKKVYYLLVEGLQNITRHQHDEHNGDPYQGGFFIIQRREEAYSITYGNSVDAATRDLLADRLDGIRSKEADELKQHYMDLLNNSQISEKGGAGLGLVDMARKSSGKLYYDFVPKGNRYFYYLNLAIQIDKDLFTDDLGQTYIDEAIAYHKNMVDEDSILMFKGLLNPENIEYLTVQIDSALKSNQDSEGLSLVMNELLRNMAKHACNRFNQAGKPGVFMLRQSDEGYQMITGNFVHSHQLDIIERSLSSVNKLSTNEMNAFLEGQLAKGGGGLMRLRKITGHSFEHHFIEAGEDTSFFILKIQVSK